MGTAIGLALQEGYIIRATDLSPKAVERAEKEAKSFGVTITFGVADFRTLEKQIPGLYDVIISCDNSLPHLLTDEDILVALRNMSAKLHPDGLLLLSIRDYDHLLQERPQTMPVSVFDKPEGRHISFQVWDWQNGQKYMIHHFILKQVNRQWDTAERITEYRALKREELTKFLLKTGFSDITWQMPEQTGYYQPVVTARKKD